MNWQVALYSAAMGLSVLTLAMYFSSTYADYIAERFSVLQGAPRAGSSSFVFRMLKPFVRLFGHLITAVFTEIGERRGRREESYFLSLRLKVQRALISAGSPEDLTADEFLGLVFFSIMLWSMLGVAAWLLFRWSFLILVGFVIGAAQPVVWLRKKISRRESEIRRLMPYALDLLTLSVEAGLDFTSALARMIPKLGNTALGEEFEEVLRVIRLGRSRAEALRGLAERVNMPEMVSFTSSMVQADELGVGIGSILRTQADQMRNDRSNRAEKRAMEAPVKILFPLIIFIFPTVFIMLFAPIAMNYLIHLFGT